MKYVWMILRVDLLSLFGRGIRGKHKNKMQIGLALLLYAALGGGVYYGSFKLFEYVQEIFVQVPGIADAVSMNIFNGLAIYVLMLVFFTGLQLTFRTLYESDDIGFLLSQPVPSASVFMAKFFTAYTSIAPLVLVFGLPLWFAWGRAYQVGFWFYVMAFVTLMVLLFLAHSAVTLLLLFAMKYLPTVKLKRLFVVVGSVFGIAIVFATQMVSSRASRGGSPVDILEQIGSSNLSQTWYLPTTWAVNSVLGTISRFKVNTFHYFLPLSLSSILLAWFAIKMSEKWYFAGWSGLSEEPSSNSKASRSSRTWSSAASRMQGAFWTVLRKDLRLLFRDPVLWYGLATSSIALGFFTYNYMRGNPMVVGGEIESLQGLTSGTIIMMVSVMGAVVGAQTGGISLSREGPSFWVLQANPTDSTALFRAKLAYAGFPSVMLMVPFFMVYEFMDVPHYPLWRELLVGLSISITVAVCQIMLDVYFPDFGIKVEIGTSKGGTGKGKMVFAMFLGMGLALALGILSMLPSMLTMNGVFEPSSLGRVSAIFHGGLLVLAITMVLLGNRFGSKQVAWLLKPM